MLSPAFQMPALYKRLNWNSHVEGLPHPHTADVLCMKMLSFRLHWFQPCNIRNSSSSKLINYQPHTIKLFINSLREFPYVIIPLPHSTRSNFVVGNLVKLNIPETGVPTHVSRERRKDECWGILSEYRIKVRKYNVLKWTGAENSKVRKTNEAGRGNLKRLNYKLWWDTWRRAWNA